ncbi:hypothetical protein QTH25_13305 [Clostridium perfringens]|uniref:hypothetical protein n=1 Tax=Clostridium perfringens TaxID=1502 RepID=UPI00338E0D94|nr:hypothetical protein [Clostridium perfringens]
MFCSNKEFRTLQRLAKYNALHCEKVYCNACKNQQKCLENGKIAFFKDVGYAQTHTYWLNNGCELTKEGHPTYKEWLKENYIDEYERLIEMEKILDK